MSASAIIVGVAAVGIGVVAYLAANPTDEEPKDFDVYTDDDNPIQTAAKNYDNQTKAYFDPDPVPYQPPLEQSEVTDYATVTTQQDAIYVPDASIPIWTNYGTTYDDVTGWQKDYVTLFGVPASSTGWKTTIAVNYANAQANKANAAQDEAMINWVKWASYEEDKAASTGQLDLSEMEQFAAWLKVNEKDDYNEFVKAWQTLGGNEVKQVTWFGSVDDPAALTSDQKSAGLYWSTSEQNKINALAAQIATQPKLQVGGGVTQTAAPSYTDIQGNQVNAYTGVISIKVQ